MKQMIEQAQMIFFDMDGTLYEGRKHYDTYAKQIKSTLPPEQHAQFIADYSYAMRKKSPLKPGNLYLKEKKWIIQVNPFTMETLAIYNWIGEPIHTFVDIKNLSPDSYITIGDPWWIPYTCAVHLGANPTFDIYEKTKEIMLQKAYNFLHTKNLKENLSKLSETKTLICITNSFSEDALTLLKFMGMLDVFSHVVAPGNKPQEIENHFYRYMNLYNATPETALSIGDNIFNEIVPALNIGMPSILLSNWNEDYQHPKLKIVPTLSDML